MDHADLVRRVRDWEEQPRGHHDREERADSEGSFDDPPRMQRRTVTPITVHNGAADHLGQGKPETVAQDPANCAQNVPGSVPP